jgi:hypothetical protein
MAESAAQPEEVGRTVAGRYVIELLLGRGGMSAVYRVHDLRTGKKLALKRGLAGSPRKMRKRQEFLEREFNTLSQLAHPCIIEVHDYGVDEQSYPYYTMELLDGEDLHNTGQLPWQRVCALLRDVASSLAILHSRGMIHRDVSGRNVRCTTDGRAKLIDFGAMTCMGVAQDVVGTPPFLAPEVLQMQALDARVDLYSLGALAYYLLTGRHAYPARRLHELRDIWRSPPIPPIRIAPDTPAALSALVMQLLSLDRATRAHSAPELMTRLCTLAGLPLAEQAQVSRAYLTTPTLIGRDRELVAVRKRMLSLARGDGGTLLVQGASGSGRSRMLDACALEAKLVGAQVIRASANSERSDWAVASVLCSQLLALLPEQAKDAARLSRDVLSQVIEGFRSERSLQSHSNSNTGANDRNLLIRELRDFILSLARQQRLVVVVDDADHIDEPSAALLAAIAYKTERHPILLALSVDRDRKQSASASLRLLHMVATTIELAQLTAEQTEALVRSVFGAVPNLPLMAARIQALSHGEPRAVMELAQHLVDRGLAHYESGSWSLPDKLSERDLPSTLSASLSARLARLSSDAREVCDALCLADGDAASLSIDDFVALSTHRDPRRVFQAFDDLVAARVLVGAGEQRRFEQRGFLAVIEQSMPRARLESIHARLADGLAERGGDLTPRVHHLLAAERDLEAIDLLCSNDLSLRPPPIALLEQAIARALKRGMPARTVHVLRRALLIKATPAMAFDSYRSHAPHVLAQLRKDSGYDHFMALSDVPEAQRLSQALTLAQAQYLATPENARVYALQEGIQEFALFAAAARAMGLLMLDADFIANLPSLEPFAALSPALRLVMLAGDGTAEWLRGRFTGAHENFTRVLTQLEAPDHANLGEAEHARIKLSMHYGLGVLEASRGVAAAETHAQILEQHRDYRVNAWRVRKIWHLAYGNIEEADKCQRRAELLQLQDGNEQAYAGTHILGELMSYVLAGDLLGIKSALDGISGISDTAPGWRPFLAFGQASRQYLQGDCAGALQTLLPALAAAPAGRHPAFAFLAGMHVNVLSGLARFDDAVQHGLAYVDASERGELTTTGQVVYVATAEALAQVGRFVEAVDMLDTMILQGEQREQSGVSIGTIYEARARVAARMHDHAGFERYAKQCADEYRKGTSPFLAAKFAQLIEDARQCELGPLQPMAALSGALPAPDTEYQTVHSRMLECVDEEDRARCALTMLLQDLESFAGYLFGVDAGTPTLLASLPEEDADASQQIERWLRRLIQAELVQSEERTLEADEDESDHQVAAPFRYEAQDGRTFEPLLLTVTQDGQQVLAAVLVFHAQPSNQRRPNRERLEQIALQLLEHRDVTGIHLAPIYPVTRRG